MIAFGVAMNDPEAYRRYARPGIERSVERDSELFAIAASGAVGRSSNLVLEAAARVDGLEALVLVSETVEITEPDVCSKVRAALTDPQVGVVGCAGASGVETIAWWDADVSAAPIVHRYNDFGAGELPGYAWRATKPAPAEVDVVAGTLMILSPWAVRNVRFDEGLMLGHGYDVDYCRQVRAAGRSVWTAAIRTTYHHPLELIEEREVWAEAHIRFAEKYAPDEDDWKARARRAEAEREAARTIAYSAQSALEAQTVPLERELREMTDTPAWRATAPLRWANNWVRERRS